MFSAKQIFDFLSFYVVFLKCFCRAYNCVSEISIPRSFLPFFNVIKHVSDYLKYLKESTQIIKHRDLSKSSQTKPWVLFVIALI